MDKLADGLQKLNEDDLLQVVQMVHDHKAADSYTKNDVERKFLNLPSERSEETNTFSSSACSVFTPNKMLTTVSILQSENSMWTCTRSRTC